MAGIVVRQVPTNPSNWRSDQKFNDWLKLNDIPGISGI
ncbi:carbamoyl-phosphate synthase small subunit, partial [Alphaproteobacteria bacterium]|nr:carbamoyl-phosphate synthase small subunit [Alphaproteobacteria bacterium]